MEVLELLLKPGVLQPLRIGLDAHAFGVALNKRPVRPFGSGNIQERAAVHFVRNRGGQDVCDRRQDIDGFNDPVADHTRNLLRELYDEWHQQNVGEVAVGAITTPLAVQIA